MQPAKPLLGSAIVTQCTDVASRHFSTGVEFKQIAMTAKNGMTVPSINDPGSGVPSGETGRRRPGTRAFMLYPLRQKHIPHLGERIYFKLKALIF